MPVCHVCSKTEFSLQDGHYVCMECHAVLEDEREIVQEFSQAMFSSASISSSRKTTQDTPEEEQEWTLYDAFNIILCQMTNSAIKCGISPEIRPLVLTLWAAWLNKMGIAFLNRPAPEDTDTEALDETLREEESNVPFWMAEEPNLDASALSDATVTTVKSSKNVPFPLQKARKKKKRKRRKSAIIDDILDLDNFLSDREKRREKRRRLNAYLSSEMGGPSASTVSSRDVSDDEISVTSTVYSRLSCVQPLLDTETDEEFDRQSGNQIPGSSTKSIRSHRRARYIISGPEYLTLAKLLSFVHAAVLLSRDHATQSDIIRWVREGHIPFFGAHQLLPSYMKLGGSNVLTLGAAANMSVVPASVSMRTNTAKLLKMLGITKIRVPPMMPLVSKIIQDLQLPSELINHIHGLVDLVEAAEPSLKYFTIAKEVPNFEARAAAFVLISLKLLLGLDGRTENTISDFAEKVNSTLNLKPASKCSTPAQRGSGASSSAMLPTLFVWTEWVHYMKYRKTLLNHYHLPTALRHGVVPEMDPDFMASFCRSTGKLWLYPNLIEKEKNYEKILQSVKEVIEQSGISQSKETFVFQPSSLPFHGLALQLYEFDPEKFEPLLQSFPETTLSFLWNPKSLKEALEEAGESLEDHPLITGEGPDFEVELVKPLSIWTKNPKRSTRPPRRMNIQPSLLRLDQPENSPKALKKFYWTQYARLSRASNEEWSKFNSNLPKSFQWILDLLSETIEEHPKMIYSQLALLESTIFPKHSKLSEKPERKKKKQQDHRDLRRILRSRKLQPGPNENEIE